MKISHLILAFLFGWTGLMRSNAIETNKLKNVAQLTDLVDAFHGQSGIYICHTERLAPKRTQFATD